MLSSQDRHCLFVQSPHPLSLDVHHSMDSAALTSALDLCSLAFQDQFSTQQWLSRLVPGWTFKSGSTLAHASHTTLFSWIPLLLALVPEACQLTSATIPTWVPSCAWCLLHGVSVFGCSYCRTPFSRISPTMIPPVVLPEAGSRSCYLHFPIQFLIQPNWWHTSLWHRDLESVSNFYFCVLESVFKYSISWAWGR